MPRRKRCSRSSSLASTPRESSLLPPERQKTTFITPMNMALKKIVVDSEDELRKLSEIVPSATVFFRLRADDPTSRVRLSEKFGLGVPEARAILQVAVDLSVKVSGICFHVGSAASDPGAYVRAIAMAREVYDYNETLSSKHPISIMDIGADSFNPIFKSSRPPSDLPPICILVEKQAFSGLRNQGGSSSAKLSI